MQNIAIFGAHTNGLKAKKMLELSDYKCVCFIDNNKDKQGLELDGIPIISLPEYVSKKETYKSIIVNAVYNVENVVEQLRKETSEEIIYALNRAFYLPFHLNTNRNYLYEISVKKPRLSYFEYHVSYHCNLNCKGCGHYSNISEPKFGDYEQYVKDIKRLKELFFGVKMIRLMGGEPLLNAQLTDFIEITRQVFPDADIRVASNGLLIPNISKELLLSMKNNAVGFDITLYPPTKKIIEKIRLLCMENDIDLIISNEVERFFRKRKSDCPELIRHNFDSCISNGCHFLENGKISICPSPILNNNNPLKKWIDVKPNEIIDIYDDELTGDILNTQLSSPINMCRYCSVIEEFEWQGNYKYPLVDN